MIHKTVFLKEYTEKIYNIELKREESLLVQSGRLITVQGLLLTIISLLISNFQVSSAFSISNLKWVLIAIIISLFLSFLVHLRIPMLDYPRINDVNSIIKDNSDKSFISDGEICEFYQRCEERNNAWLSVVNKIRSVLISLSSIAFIIGIIILAIKVYKQI